MKIGLHTAFPQTAKKWLGINNLNVIQIQQRTGNRNNRKYHQTRWLFRESLFEMWRTNGMLKKNEKHTGRRKKQSNDQNRKLEGTWSENRRLTTRYMKKKWVG